MGSIKENILSLRSENKSYKEISKLLNCSRGYISTVCKANNVNDIGLKGYKELTPLEILELKEYYKTHTKQETADKFGVSGITVNKYKDYKRIVLTEEESIARNYINVKSFRKRNKEKAVEYKGGKCSICDYNKCITALEFHHLDPSEKDFTVSNNINKAWSKIKEELDKCILVCANCHREIHEEIYKMPA